MAGCVSSVERGSWCLLEAACRVLVGGLSCKQDSMEAPRVTFVRKERGGV